jgi:hypothetical protein
MAKQKTAARTVPQADPAIQPAVRRSRKAELREAAARRRRNQNLMMIAGAALVVVLVIAVVALNLRGQQPVAGEQSFASQGNLHIPLGSASPVAYNSTPPTSGPHYEGVAAWGVHDTPVRYEQLVHNLEDGGVVIYYQCPEGCPEVVAELTEIVDSYRASDRHVVLAPNDPTWTDGGAQPLQRDMGAAIALTAWQKLLMLDAVDAGKIRAFIERYEGIDHHPR